MTKMKISLQGWFVQISVDLNSPSLVTKMFFPCFGEDISYMGFYSLLSGRKRGKVREHFAPTISQVPLAQNNPYTKVVYFGVAYSTILHIHKVKFMG